MTVLLELQEARSLLPFLFGSRTPQGRSFGSWDLSCRTHTHLVSLPQIKRRASEALPELLRPVTPITNFEGSQSQDHSGIFGLVTNLEDLEVDDWEF